MIHFKHWLRFLSVGICVAAWLLLSVASAKERHPRRPFFELSPDISRLRDLEQRSIEHAKEEWNRHRQTTNAVGNLALHPSSQNAIVKNSIAVPIASPTTAPFASPLAETTLEFDSKTNSLSSKTRFVIQSLIQSVTEVSVLVPSLLGSSTPVFSDDQGALNASQPYAGYPFYVVTLRAPLAANQISEIQSVVTGTATCASTIFGQSSGCIAENGVILATQWIALLFDASAQHPINSDSAKLTMITDHALQTTASALLVSDESLPDGRRKQHFENKVSSYMIIAIGPYTVETDPPQSNRTFSITSFVSANNATFASAWRTKAAEIMAFHEARYGFYPAPKLDLVEIPNAVSAAIGPYSAVFIPGSLLGDAPLKSDAEVLSVKFDPDSQICARRKSALVGDIVMNGEVDGIDLIHQAAVVGFDYFDNEHITSLFPDWADTNWNGKVHHDDLQSTLDHFGKRTGEL